MRKTLSTENFKIHVFGTDDNSFNVTAVILLKAVTGDKQNILGAEFEFVGDDKNRINLFEKNEKLLIGGIDIFNELHIFLADTGSEEKLQAWINRLTSLEALNPEIVIPSHADLNASFDKKALSATKEYLQKTIEFTKASSPWQIY